ncbi:MAG: hypothetical protein HY000_07500 [Planctomycetes bacterium]|nr:hypothetical protein [Planctomycetota bacterium]
MYGSDGDDDLEGEAGKDYLDGGRGNDDCLGGLDDDMIHGGKGNDHLNGEDGNDLLDGDGGSDQEEDGFSVDLDLEFKAHLTGPTGATGRAKMEIEQEEDGLEAEFKVEFDGATANTTFDVTVDGVVVGQVTSDAVGHGKLKFSNDPDEGDEGAFASAFPEIQANSVVTVGNGNGVVLEGTFGRDSGSDGGSDGGSN